MSKIVHAHYYIDGSQLSIPEYRRVYKMIDNESFMCNPDESAVRCFVSAWLHPEPPDKFFSLPEGCVVRQI